MCRDESHPTLITRAKLELCYADLTPQELNLLKVGLNSMGFQLTF